MEDGEIYLYYYFKFNILEKLLFILVEVVGIVVLDYFKGDN